MTDEIRAALIARLKELDMTQADLARAVDKTPQDITRTLKGRAGKVPALWQSILDAVEMEVAIRPKQPKINRCLTEADK